MSSNIDPAKLKVADLRTELSARGLDVKGTKPILVKRLKEALEKELEKELPDTSIADTSTEDIETAVTPRKSLRSSTDDKDEAKTKNVPKVSTPSVEKTKQVAKTPEKTAVIVEPTTTPTKNAEVEAAPVIVPEEAKSVEKPPVKPVKMEIKTLEQPKTVVKSPEKPVTKSPEEPVIKSPEGPVTKPPEKPTLKAEESVNEVKVKKYNAEQLQMDVEEDSHQNEKGRDDKNYGEQKGEKRKRSNDSPERAPKRARSPIREDEPPIDADTVLLSWYDSDLHLQIDKSTFLSAKPIIDGAFGYVWSGARATHGVSTGKVCFEVKVTEKINWDEFYRQDNRFRTDHRRRDGRRYQKKDEKHQSDYDKAKEENSDNKEETMEVNNEAENNVKTENAAKTDEAMDATECEEKNIAENGEEKAKEEAIGDEKKEEELPPLPSHFIRVGWSVASSSLQLGEDKNSYAYESSGKMVKESEFLDYGDTFDVGDVVGAYADISATEIIIQFTKNGQKQPPIKIPKTDLAENFVLYPHILSRNYSFEVNFGNKEEPWFTNPLEFAEYKYISKFENKVAGKLRPENRSDCEVLLMFGIPASGKTYWVKEHVASNLDKNYTVLGNTAILERMTISGEPLKSKYRGKWGLLVDRLQKCLNRLLSIAAYRRRNYIIDQTNVFPSAQRRKLRPFEGFKRKAVIVLNEEEEQTRRQAFQEALDGKEIPDSNILELKAAMALPETGDWLEEITYVGVTEEEAKEIVKKYNTEGREAGYPAEKIFNRDRWSYRRNDYRSGRNSNFQRSGGYNRQPYPPNRWGPSRHGGGGGGGGGGGWKQDSRGRDWRGYDRRDRDYYSQGGYGNRSQQSGNRSQGSVQRWGGGGGGGGGWGGQAGWNQQNYGRSYSQNWSGQSGWGGKYGSGGGQNQNYGYGNWNYYGQQGQHAQNWGSQGQQQVDYAATTNATAQSQSQGQYSQAYSTQEAWAQYAKQYAQHQQMAQNQAAAAATAQKR